MSAPPYGFPGFMPAFDEDGAREFLEKEGFPPGFAELLISQSEKVAHRFFVSSWPCYDTDLFRFCSNSNGTSSPTCSFFLTSFAKDPGRLRQHEYIRWVQALQES